MKHLLLALIIGLTAMGCRDREEYNPKLPPATQVGANTFGAIINGKVMVPKGDKHSNNWLPGPKSKCTYYTRDIYDNKYEKIVATDCYSFNRENISIYLENKGNDTITSKGVYTFDDATYLQPDEGIIMRCYWNKSRYVSIAKTGNITLTRNDNEVISGIFCCKLRNVDNHNDIIEVREGRFDFNKKTINNKIFE